MRQRFTPAIIALVALLIALTTVLTVYTVRVPVPATQGYFNLSDVPITFIGLVFGPWIGLIAGGVGTALSDLLGGYGFYAPISFVAHGLEGLLIGLIGYRSRSVPVMILAWLVGGLAMMLVYFLAEVVLKGFPAAIVEVPVNAAQAVIGGLIGIPLAIGVRAAYPPIEQIGRRRTWTE